MSRKLAGDTVEKAWELDTADRFYTAYWVPTDEVASFYEHLEVLVQLGEIDPIWDRTDGNSYSLFILCQLVASDSVEATADLGV